LGGYFYALCLRIA
jgi:hypothetical protein